MTRSTNMEHVEVLRDLSEVCRAAIKAGDWRVDGACDPDSLLRHADAALASLSAPQPPAEAQPVAAAPGGLLPCPFCGADSADTGGLLPWVECTDCDASGPSCGTEEEAVAAWNRRTQPPSAPVGVEGFDEWFDEYTKNNYTDEMLALAAWKQALAQQPAAVDGALRAEVERLRLLAGNQHELMKAHGVPLPEDYALPAAADAFVKEYVARRERATRAEAEVEALRRDAERYRWLRDRHDKTHQDWHVRDQWNNVPAIGGLDAAIDAAREARNG